MMIEFQCYSGLIAVDVAEELSSAYIQRVEVVYLSIGYKTVISIETDLGKCNHS